MEIVVGIDVSKDRLDVHVWPSGEAFAVARHHAGLLELQARLDGLGPARIGVEATGGYETVVAASLAGQGHPVVVVNPAQVRAFAVALGQRAKTDPIDAAVIARFVAATRPEIRPLPDAATQLLADLVARRSQIVAMIGAEQQRRKRTGDRRLLRSLDRLVAALEKELSHVETAIDDAVRGSPAWREKEDLLASVPGVGPQTARRLIADMPELGALDRRQVAALAGLAPFTRQRALGPVRRRHGRRPAQPRPQGLRRPPQGRRQTPHRRPRRRRAKAPHHPQRRPARQNPLENHLTRKTVASRAFGAPGMTAVGSGDGGPILG